MRYNKLLLGLLGLVLIGTCFKSEAQTNVPPGKLSLWKAKGKNNTVYFLGSIHFLKAAYYPLPAPIENAYADSEIVVFETEMDRMNDPATAQKIMKEGSYPAGKSIADEISKETYQLLRTTLSRKIGQPTALDSYKPYLVGITLAALELQRLGFQPKDGVDQYFSAKATKDKKQKLPLETIEEQMRLFSALSKPDQEAFLKSSLTEMDQMEKFFQEILTAWKKGDSDGLNELLMESMKDYPELVKRFLTDRNKRWIPEFEKLLQGDKDALVVVGAAHLVGTDSVIELLKAKNIKVEQEGAGKPSSASTETKP